MLYTEAEVFDFIKEEDVQFIRLAFCDLAGRQKNISILPEELERAFRDGISFDASAIRGFGSVEKSDLLLFPIPSTLSILPWRPMHGKVVRMFCNIRYPDGTPFEKDSRGILCRAVEKAAAMGISVRFGAEFEFYLFRTGEDGEPTRIPFDRAGYMDVAPDDKGENIRREICLALLEMGIQPESSHHEEGPGQNEIDFRYSDAVSAADHAMNFLAAVKATADRNGLVADFSPKPLENESGNGFHINISLAGEGSGGKEHAFLAGVLAHIREITAVLNPEEASYRRLGERKAPKYIAWSKGNRSTLVRIPAAKGEYTRMELRSPDPAANPYLAFALLIHAGLDGVEKNLPLPPEVTTDLFAKNADTAMLQALPGSLEEALEAAKKSAFFASVLPGYFGE